MNPAALLDRLSALGASLEADDGKLKVRAGKGVISPDLLAQMKAQKPALMALLSRPKGTDYPQSTNQSQLWFLDRMQPGNPMYNNPLALRLDGDCNIAALDAALQSVISRHAVLRTLFFDQDGEPRQRVLDDNPTKLAITDITGLKGGTQEQRADELVRRHAERPFDLETEPGISAELLILKPTANMLLLNVHHICADGWSIGILLEELIHLYNVNTSNGPSALPALNWQYSDFVLEQRSRLKPTEVERQVSYWRETLADAPDLLELPTDRPRPALQTFAGAHLRLALPANLRPKVEAFCQTRGVSPFSMFLAAHAIIMTRYSNQDDICIGTPLAGRNSQEVEPLIGHFINTVAIRAKLASNPRFGALQRQINDNIIGAIENQDIAFEKVVEAVNPKRSTSHAPLFQTMMIFQNTPEAKPQNTGDLKIQPVTTDSATAKYDITIELFQADETYVLGLEYNTDLFDHATIERLANQFETVIYQMLDDPDIRIDDLTLSTPRPLLGPKIEIGATQTIHGRFKEIAGQFPDKIAVEDDQTTLTFEALEGLSNNAAAFLQTRGITPGSSVALVAQPDVQYVALQLAVLKCGAAFIPIDPDMPVQRLMDILGDGEAALVLTSANIVQDLKKHGFTGQTHVLDAVAHEATTPAQLPQVQGDDLAAIVFTSGSTGRPKGARVLHQGLVNLASWTQDAFPNDGPVLQKSSPGFDASLWEFFWPLLSGRRLIIAQGDDRRDPSLLGRKVARQGIATVQFVPATLQLFLDGLQDRDGERLLDIFCGGGILSTTLARQVAERLPNAKLINVYGVTECSVDSTFHIYDPSVDTGAAVPIGQPIANTAIALLDRKGRPVPHGAAGEICIGGTGVGTGYVNHDNGAFATGLANNSEPWFRSGDTARLNNHGRLEYLGRRDFQIKLNGFRMEPAEIEAALLTCGCDAAVALVADEILVAYVTGASDPTTLKPALATMLPAYMIPSIIIEMDGFPLNASGKIDRKALPSPINPVANNAVNQTTPRDATELELYNIWKAILLHPSIGIRDNFFDIGGSSISAIKMLHLIRQNLGTTLTLRSIIANPTIEDLGGLLREGGDATQGEEGRITFQRGTGAASVVCVHPAGGTAFCYLSLAKAVRDDISVYGVQSPGLNEGEVLAPTVEAMAAHYLDMIKDLRDGPLVITGLSFGGLVAHEMGRLLALDGKEDVSVVLLDTQGTHDADQRRQINTVDMDEFREKLVRFNGTYPGISDGQIERYYDVYNHNRLTVRDYEVPVSNARIAFIQALSDLPRHFLHDVRRYWKSRTAGRFSVKLVRGDHWDMLETAELKTVEKVIMRELAAISGPQGSRA